MSGLATSFIESALSGRLPHAVFIVCDDEERAISLARRAAAAYCTGNADEAALSGFPDYFELGDGPVKIDAVRSLGQELIKRPFNEGGRAILFKHADRMGESAQNALLKTLEEPPDKTVFFLTGNEAGMLHTVYSRCGILRIPGAAAVDAYRALISAGATEAEARCLAVCGGTTGRALRLFGNEALREARDASLSMLVECLCERRLPFQKAKALSDGGFAADAVDFMLSFTRDMLVYGAEGIEPENIDRLGDIDRLAPRFTRGAINCIIEALGEAKRRLLGNAAPAATLDRLLTELSEVKHR